MYCNTTVSCPAPDLSFPEKAQFHSVPVPQATEKPCSPSSPEPCHTDHFTSVLTLLTKIRR